LPGSLIQGFNAGTIVVDGIIIVIAPVLLWYPFRRRVNVESWLLKPPGPKPRWSGMEKHFQPGPPNVEAGPYR